MSLTTPPIIIRHIHQHSRLRSYPLHGPAFTRPFALSLPLSYSNHHVIKELRLLYYSAHSQLPLTWSQDDGMPISRHKSAQEPLVRSLLLAKPNILSGRGQMCFEGEGVPEMEWIVISGGLMRRCMWEERSMLAGAIGWRVAA